MNPEAPIVVLPYVASIGLKLSSLVFERQMTINTLEKLALLNKPKGQAQDLTADQIAVMADWLGLSFLRLTAISTSLISFIVAIVIVMGQERCSPTGLLWTLPVFVIIGFLLVWWVHTKEVNYFAAPGSLGIRRDICATFLFCLYDVLLAALSVAAGLVANAGAAGPASTTSSPAGFPF